MPKRKMAHSQKENVRKKGMRIINIVEPTEDDEYLGSIDARMTRTALRLSRKRKVSYIA